MGGEVETQNDDSVHHEERNVIVFVGKAKNTFSLQIPRIYKIGLLDFSSMFLRIHKRKTNQTQG